jgi:hypothetical protein
LRNVPFPKKEQEKLKIEPYQNLSQGLFKVNNDKIKVNVINRLNDEENQQQQQQPQPQQIKSEQTQQMTNRFNNKNDNKVQTSDEIEKLQLLNRVHKEYFIFFVTKDIEKNCSIFEQKMN